MGKGDKKSKKGKRWRNSYGNSRNRKAIREKLVRTASGKGKVAEVAVAAGEAKPKRAPRKKAEA